MKEGFVPGYLATFYWEASVIRNHSHEQKEKWRYMRQGCLKAWTGGPVAGQLPTVSIHSGVSGITSDTVRGQPAPETDARICLLRHGHVPEPTGWIAIGI